VFSKVAADYGDVVPLYLGHQKLLLVSDPELIRQVLVKDNDKFCRGRALNLIGKLLGRAFLTTPADPDYTRVRSLMQPFFLPNRAPDYGAATLRALTSFHDRLEKITLQPGAVFDLGTEMAGLQLDIGLASLCGFNAEGGCYDVVNAILDIFEMASVFNLLPDFVQKLPLPITLRCARHARTLDRFVETLVQRQQKENLEANNILAVLLRDRDRLTYKKLRDHIVVFMFASLEAPSTALVWVFYLLQRNPKVLARLREEIDNCLGSSELTVENVANLKYARAVIAESMRFMPPTWMLARKALEPYQLREHIVPAGAEILMSPYVVQRDARFFPDPLTYKPERWLEVMPHPKYAYFPFGGGPRVCAGEQFSWINLPLILVSLARKWDFLPVSDKEVKVDFTFTLKPKKKIFVRPEKRGHVHASPKEGS
jgi:cytochrome P450